MAKARRRRRSRRNAAPGVLGVNVKGYSRKGRKRRAKKAKAKKNPRRAKRRAKANPKRRAKRRTNKGGKRRRRTSRKNKGTVKRRRSRKAKGTTKRRRRSRKARKNPAGRRRRARKNKGGARRRRSSRKNPGGARRRRSSRGRRNPGFGSAVTSVRGELKKLMKPMVWLPAAIHGAIGFGLAGYGPQVLSQYTSRLGLSNTGFGGVALSAVSTALGAGLVQTLAGFLPKKGMFGACCRGIGRNVFVGGAIATVIRLAKELAPGNRFVGMLPNVGMSGFYGMGLGAAGYGGYPGQYPSYAPLGLVTSPEELVAGESMARQMGNELGQPVPIEALRDWMELSGMRGMNDWAEFDPTSGFVQQAEMTPGAESF